MIERTVIGVIRPEDVAHKLAAIRNYEHPVSLDQITANPRLVELLWFLQHESMQPGGLNKFVDDMLTQVPSRFGTFTMREFRDSELTTNAKLDIWEEIPARFRPEGSPRTPNEVEAEWTVEVMLSRDSLRDYSTGPKVERKQLDQFLKPWDMEAFRKICERAARENLPQYLAEICTQGNQGFQELGGAHRRLWFISDPIAAVFEMMDRRAQRVSQRLAMTEVSKKVFDALDYAHQERAMVRIEGDSRFGKTESVRAWCDMRPGCARLVSVPSSNSLADLHKRIAEALGMDVSYGSRTQRLRERVEFVMRHSGLFLVLDEAAFLVPQNYTPATAPARINWVRTELVDRGLPLALVVTPQTFLPMMNKFVRRTGYTAEQFFGRNARTVSLPAVLDVEDLVAVARIHFPELSDSHLEIVARLAGIAQNYLHAVEAIAKLSRHVARREGHKRVTVGDIETAASEVLPRRISEPAQDPGEQETSESRQSRPSGVTAARTRKPSLTIPERGVQPALNRSAESEFTQRSLRGAGSERASAELISA
jgi:hypothetical protein